MIGRLRRRAPKTQQKPGAPPPLEYSVLLTVTLCLLAFGAVMVFSASSARSLLAEHGDGYYYFKRTVIFAALGLLAMRVLAAKGAPAARALTPVLLVLSLVGLIAVLVPGVGHAANGSQRWIGAGLIQIQPAELAKVALVLYGAHLLASRPRRIRSLVGLRPYLFVVAFACFLIAVEPDLGSMMVCGFAVFSLLVAAGVKMRTLAPVAALIVFAALVMTAIHPYQQERLTGFIDPAADSTGAGFQATQAKIALGSGGVFGVGLGESVQKASYLPEAHTDMIAAVIGEEVGLVGIATLIGLFGLFGWAGFRAAHSARDRYSKLMAAGLTSLILAQAAVNLFAVLGLAPLTGVTLPFVSYGGSSLVVTLASAGLILNVARTRGIAAAADTKRGSGARKRAASGAGSGRAAKLRAIDGGEQRTRQPKRVAPSRAQASGARSDRGRRDRRARRAGDRRRRRAAV
ncbi:MAG: putative lipid II flippase FtsW [Solirubrobacterales bacterium]